MFFKIVDSIEVDMFLVACMVVLEKTTSCFTVLNGWCQVIYSSFFQPLFGNDCLQLTEDVLLGKA